eukprot:8590019-Karenia_brevis.AAC.1
MPSTKRAGRACRSTLSASGRPSQHAKRMISGSVWRRRLRRVVQGGPAARCRQLQCSHLSLRERSAVAACGAAGSGERCRGACRSA